MKVRPYCVYRIYDFDDLLLYVGCSLSPLLRIYSHSGKLWGCRIMRVDLIYYETQAIALQHEIDAIRNENPEFNIRDAVEKAEKKIKRENELLSILNHDDWHTFNGLDREFYWTHLKRLENTGVIVRHPKNYMQYKLGIPRG